MKNGSFGKVLATATNVIGNNRLDSRENQKLLTVRWYLWLKGGIGTMNFNRHALPNGIYGSKINVGSDNAWSLDCFGILRARRIFRWISTSIRYYLAPGIHSLLTNKHKVCISMTCQTRRKTQIQRISVPNSPRNVQSFLSFRCVSRIAQQQAHNTGFQ